MTKLILIYLFASLVFYIWNCYVLDLELIFQFKLRQALEDKEYDADIQIYELITHYLFVFNGFIFYQMFIIFDLLHLGSLYFSIFHKDYEEEDI
ncbi:MAG: hypothetical protein ACRCVJ_16925 [Clostridium sp.]|uniref:hypothetical protein n=1 Tax=Clostridium sp. TaxID=1506 RepID=UPI003F3549C7